MHVRLGILGLAKVYPNGGCCKRGVCIHKQAHAAVVRVVELEEALELALARSREMVGDNEPPAWLETVQAMLEGKYVDGGFPSRRYRSDAKL